MNKQDIHCSVSGWMASPLHKKKKPKTNGKGTKRSSQLNQKDTGV